MTADPPEAPTTTGEPPRGTLEASTLTVDRPAGDRQKPIRVLIVDDEPSICQALSALFGLHGLEVVTVLSASEAREALDSASFDVLLLDLRLRDGRGDAVFRGAVETHPALRDRTLFMTGDITAEAERIIATTNCPFLRKPFDITLAVQAIAALLGITYQPADPTTADQRRKSSSSINDDEQR